MQLRNKPSPQRLHVMNNNNIKRPLGLTIFRTVNGEYFYINKYRNLTSLGTDLHYLDGNNNSKRITIVENAKLYTRPYSFRLTKGMKFGCVGDFRLTNTLWITPNEFLKVYSIHRQIHLLH